MPDNNPAPSDPLSGLLGALVGGHPAVQEHMQNTGQSLEQVLGNLSAGANAPSESGPTRGSFGDLFGSLMGGSPQAGSAPLQDAGGDPLGALLGGLLGGGMSPSGGLPAQGTGGGDPLSSFLGGLQGGGPAAPDASAASADPMSALLGGLLGGGMQGGPAGAGAGSLGNNAFLAPIVEAIASKIGLPPQIAGVVVSFALNQLMGGQRDPQLAQMLGGKGIVSQKYLRDSGLVSQLAEQTGMDNKSAVKSLQQVFKAFGTQMSEGTMEKRQADLQSWLATS